MIVRHPAGARGVGHPPQAARIGRPASARLTWGARGGAGIRSADPETGGGPRADDRLRSRLRQAGDRNLEDQGRDVLVREEVLLAGLRPERVVVEEVHDLRKVDGERVLPLSDEGTPVAAPRNGDVVDVIARVGVVLRNGLAADVVDRLLEGGGGPFDPRDRLSRTAAAFAADDREGVGFLTIEVGRVVLAGTERPDVDERDRDLDATHSHREVLRGDGRTELERDVLDRIAVVVDHDLVDAGRIQREVIRTVTRLLPRVVVRHEGHEPVTSGLVAAKHVEVRPVELRCLGDTWRFAVTRTIDRHRQRERGRYGARGRSLQSFHQGVPPKRTTPLTPWLDVASPPAKLTSEWTSGA